MGLKAEVQPLLSVLAGVKARDFKVQMFRVSEQYYNHNLDLEKTYPSALTEPPT